MSILKSLSKDNMKLEELKAEASLYKIDSPIVNFDHTLLKVDVRGDLLMGGIATDKEYRTLSLAVECKTREDGFIEIIIPLTKSGKTVNVMLSKNCDGPGCNLS